MKHWLFYVLAISMLVVFNVHAKTPTAAGSTVFYANTPPPVITCNVRIKVFIEGLFNSDCRYMVPDTVTVIFATSPTEANWRKYIVEVQEDGFITFNCNLTDATPFFIGIKHWRSIRTWSMQTVTPVDGEVFFDFTSNPAVTAGGNVAVINSACCMYTGDVNNDEFIDFSDVTLIETASGNFESGYIITDLNGDGFVDFSDLTIADNNSNNFIGEVPPPYSNQ